MKLCSKSKHSPRWKRHDLWPQWNIVPVEKAFWLQWNISCRLIPLMEKAWFYERLFFEEVIVMVKEYCIKDTMSIKISFMHYIKWTSKTSVTSSFWGIWNGLYFFATFFIFTIIINWWKVNFSKNLGVLQPPPAPSVSTGLMMMMTVSQQDVKLIADLVISSSRDLVSASFKNAYFLLSLLLLLLKVDDVTI